MAIRAILVLSGAQETGEKGKGVSLSNTDYILVEDLQKGTKRVEKGPRVWFPAPLEKGTPGHGISLGSDEYVLVLSLSQRPRIAR